MGGGREPEIPKIFALSWKGNVVKFDAVQTGKGSAEQGWIIDWCISNVRIPLALEKQSDAVFKLLREGLDAMGNSGCERNKNVDVNVHFQ